MKQRKRDWFYQSSFWRLSVPRMFTNLNMNDNNRKIGLGKKQMLEVKKCFVCKTPFLKKFWIKFSRKLKNYMSKICQNFQKVEVAINIFKWSCALVFINNVNVGILQVSWNDSKILSRWQSEMWFRRCFRILQLEQATNNLKRSVKHDF